MVYSYNGLPHRNEKEPTTATHNTNEAHRSDIARKNLNTKETTRVWFYSHKIQNDNGDHNSGYSEKTLTEKGHKGGGDTGEYYQ